MPEDMFQFLLLVTIALLIFSNILLAFVIWTRGGRPVERIYHNSPFDQSLTPGDFTQDAAIPDPITDQETPIADLESVYLSNAALIGSLEAIEARYSGLHDWRAFRSAYEDWSEKSTGKKVVLPKTTSKAIFRAILNRRSILAKTTINQANAPAATARARKGTPSVDD